MGILSLLCRVPPSPGPTFSPSRQRAGAQPSGESIWWAGGCISWVCGVRFTVGVGSRPASLSVHPLPLPLAKMILTGGHVNISVITAMGFL